MSAITQTGAGRPVMDPMEATIAMEDAMPELGHLFPEHPSLVAVGTTGATTRRGEVVYPGDLAVPVAAMSEILKWASSHADRALALAAEISETAADRHAIQVERVYGPRQLLEGEGT